jgi:GAF domain-containing protein
MTTPDGQLVRFLQQECARLKDDNQLLTDEVQALRRYVKALRAFQSTVQRFTPERDILALLDDTMQSALNLLDAADGSVLLLDEETDELVFVLVHGAVRDALRGHRFDRHRGIAGWVAVHAEPAVVADVATDVRFLSAIDRRYDFQTHSLIAVPLIARGRVLGVIEVINERSGTGFSEDDAGLLSVLATLAASALDYAASAPVAAV